MHAAAQLVLLLSFPGLSFCCVDVQAHLVPWNNISRSTQAHVEIVDVAVDKLAMHNLQEV